VATILVTGGAGYVGSHVCKALARRGHEPVAYDSLERGHRDLVRWGPLERGDVRDAARLDTVFARHRPEAVVHLAAYAYVGESWQDPGRYYLNNVTGAVTLLAAMVRFGVDRIVFSSTCATYGHAEGPLVETHPQRPTNPYGASKLMVEGILADFDVAHSVRSVALRYFNAAGADPDAEIGERHDPETHLIPLVLQAAAGERDAVHVHGDRYPTPDGTCIRDYVHVSDLATAHAQALDYLAAGGTSTALNLGTGAGWSVLQVIDVARRVTGRPIPTHIRGARPGDPPALVAAPGRAEAVLAWRPSRPDLDMIVADAWRWHARDRHARDRPTDDRPTDDRPTDDRPTDDRPTDDRPTDDRPTGDRGSHADHTALVRET
jgi:UDP-arabinose 4-epimerase